MPFVELIRIATDGGAKPPHVRLLLRAWLAGRDLAAHACHPGFVFPERLSGLLPDLEAVLAPLARVVSEHRSADGSRRLLLALADGMTVESVLLQRDAVCVSSQVGCAVGCVFCKTGESGLLRQLTCEEILAQVALARRRQRVLRVVFMGMGEPAHNVDAVLQAIGLLGGEGQIAHKNLIFSTVGSRSCFAALARGQVRPALALSLHSTDADKRRELLPRAPQVDPPELIALAERYARFSGHPVQYQWTLLGGVNDGDDEFDRLIELLDGRHAIVNLIPMNELEGYPYQRPDWEHGVALVRRLRRAGILATLRRSGGQDVAAACGQLRARGVVR